MEEFEQETKKLKVNNVPIDELKVEDMYKYILQAILHGCEIRSEVASIIDRIPLTMVDDFFLVNWVYRAIEVTLEFIYAKLLAHKRSIDDQPNW